MREGKHKGGAILVINSEGKSSSKGMKVFDNENGKNMAVEDRDYLGKYFCRLSLLRICNQARMTKEASGQIK